MAKYKSSSPIDLILSRLVSRLWELYAPTPLQMWLEIFVETNQVMFLHAVCTDDRDKLVFLTDSTV